MLGSRVLIGQYTNLQQLRSLFTGALVALLAASALPGCAQRVSVAALQSGEIGALSKAGNYPYDDYRVEPGDSLAIHYSFQPEMDERGLAVLPNGKIATTLAGEVQAVGLTTGELAKKVALVTAPTLRDPEVVVTVERFSPKNVYVAGEVQHPGLIPYRAGLTPLQAVIGAGGFLETAMPESVVLIRSTGSEEFVARKLDLEAVLERGVPEALFLAPHDVLYVPKTSIAAADLWMKQHFSDLVPFVSGAGATAKFP